MLKQLDLIDNTVSQLVFAYVMICDVQLIMKLPKNMMTVEDEKLFGNTVAVGGSLQQL